jgi:hypothetical protein
MTDPTSSGQHLLMNDQNKIKKAVRHTTIVVNSRDRNYLKYPNSSDFRYTLRRPLTNVMSIELINGSIPTLLYTIQSTWGSFNFSEGNLTAVVVLTPGLYTESALCLELQNKLNAINGKQNTYTVSFDPITQKNTITATNISPVVYRILFLSGYIHDEIDSKTLAIVSINTPARLLGFGYNDYESVGGIIKSPLPMDLEYFLNRIYLHIESDGKNLSIMELGAGKHDCFHIFYIHPGKNNYKFLNKDIDHSIFISSPAPLARMSNLIIQLRDEFNRLIDLNSREINLVFDITHLE